MDEDWMFWPADEYAERAAALDRTTIFKNANGDQWIENKEGERQYLNSDLPAGVDFKLIGERVGQGLSAAATGLGAIMKHALGPPDSAALGYRTLNINSPIGIDPNISMLINDPSALRKLQISSD